MDTEHAGMNTVEYNWAAEGARTVNGNDVSWWVEVDTVITYHTTLGR